MDKNLTYSPGVGLQRQPQIKVVEPNISRIQAPRKEKVYNDFWANLSNVASAAGSIFGNVNRIQSLTDDDVVRRFNNEYGGDMTISAASIAQANSFEDAKTIADSEQAKWYNKAMGYTHNARQQSLLKESIRGNILNTYKSQYIKKIDTMRLKDQSILQQSVKSAVRDNDWTALNDAVNKQVDSGYLTKEQGVEQIDSVRKSFAMNQVLIKYRKMNPTDAIAEIDKKNSMDVMVGGKKVTLNKNDLSYETNVLLGDLNQDKTIRNEKIYKQTMSLQDYLAKGGDIVSAKADPKFNSLSDEQFDNSFMFVRRYNSEQSMNGFITMYTKGELTQKVISDSKVLVKSDKLILLNLIKTGKTNLWADYKKHSDITLSGLKRRILNGEAVSTVLNDGGTALNTHLKQYGGLGDLSAGGYAELKAFASHNSSFLRIDQVDSILKQEYGKGLDSDLLEKTKSKYVEFVQNMISTNQNVSNEAMPSIVTGFYESMKDESIAKSVESVIKGYKKVDTSSGREVLEASNSGELNYFKYTDPDTYVKASEILFDAYHQITGKDADKMFMDGHGLAVFEAKGKQYTLDIQNGHPVLVDYQSFLNEHKNLREFNIPIGKRDAEGYMLKNGYWSADIEKNKVKNMKQLFNGNVTGEEVTVFKPLFLKNGTYKEDPGELIYIVYKGKDGVVLRQFPYSANNVNQKTITDYLTKRNVQDYFVNNPDKKVPKDSGIDNGEKPPVPKPKPKVIEKTIKNEAKDKWGNIPGGWH